MSTQEIPPRWAFEEVEKARCEHLGLTPNPLNIDVWMSNPTGWRTEHAWAAYIARKEAAALAT